MLVERTVGTASRKMPTLLSVHCQLLNMSALNDIESLVSLEQTYEVVNYDLSGALRHFCGP